MHTEHIYKIITCLALTGLFLTACKNRSNETGNQNSVQIPGNAVVLNKEQIKLADIVTGNIAREILSEPVECSGTIEVHPNSKAVVSAPVGGFIKSVPYYPGNYVKKGTVLVTLEHPDYIRLQQDYLETKNQIEYLKEEFKRQGELTMENASSVKKMQQAQADYRVAEVKLLSLAAQLKLLNINPDSLRIDGIKTTIALKAPISGDIVKVNASIGKYAPPNEMIYEIVNTDDLHVHLDVYEKDIHKIRKNQDVVFRLANDGEKIYTGVVNSIGQMVDEETSSFGIHVHIEKGSTIFKPGMHVYAEIFVSSDSVYVVPTGALINAGEKDYIFRVKDTLFIRTPVLAGVKSNDLVELTNLPDSLVNQKIVVSGAYYLNAEYEKEEEPE